jgi:hypothetical protein
MRDVTRSTIILLVLAVAAAAFVGCSSSGSPSQGSCAVLPPDLPNDPEPCTTYCRVWVPPVYRDVPKLVQVKPPRMVTKEETVCRLRFQEVCVKPRETKLCRTPGTRCESSVVQVRPGGYKWKPTGEVDSCGQECWSYCYEPPCYQWCDKVVTEDGIEYCAEIPPEYKTVAYREPVVECRQECAPGEYEVEWVKEVYRPGYWAWKPSKNCTDCDCPAPCPTMPRKEQPCRNWLTSVPRSN